jgi:predicted dehydrogenase
VVAQRPPQPANTLAGEDAITLLAELGGGALGLLSNSLAARGIPRVQWATLTGTRGSGFADNRGRFVVTRGESGPRLAIFRRDVRGYEAMLTAFRQAIACGHATEMDGAAGRADLAVVLSAYRSIEERRPVDLDPLPVS